MARLGVRPDLIGQRMFLALRWGASFGVEARTFTTGTHGPTMRPFEVEDAGNGQSTLRWTTLGRKCAQAYGWHGAGSQKSKQRKLEARKRYGLLGSSFDSRLQKLVRGIFSKTKEARLRVSGRFGQPFGPSPYAMTRRVQSGLVEEMLPLRGCEADLFFTPRLP